MGNRIATGPEPTTRGSVRWLWLRLLLLLGPASSAIASAEPIPRAEKPLCSEVREGGHPAEEEARCTPYAFPKYFRALVGFGAVPLVEGASLGLDLDLSPHSFSGKAASAGALSSGLSLSLAGAADGRWVLAAGGVFIQLDLLYPFLSHGWKRQPPNRFPFRLLLGSRLGLGASASFHSGAASIDTPPYVLLRPELHSYLDLEFPLEKWRRTSLVFRVGADTPLSIRNPYRWNVSVGFNWGWADE